MAETGLEWIDSDTIDIITHSSYLHLAHYHDFGNDNVNEWINVLKNTKQQAKNYFQNNILEIQQQKEMQKLNEIFKGNCTLENLIAQGFNIEDSKKFYDAFYRGKNGTTIDEKINALNDIQHMSLSNDDIPKTAANQAYNVLEQAFSNDKINVSFNSLEEERIFIEVLFSIANSIQEVAVSSDFNDTTEGNALLASVRKLNSAIQYYKKDYLKKKQKRTKSVTELDQIFNQIDEFCDIHGTKDWKKEYQQFTNIGDVKTVIKRSASGFLAQAGGLNYEQKASENFKKTFINIFQNTLDSGNAKTKGRKTSSGQNIDKVSKTQQKADINLTFTTTYSDGQKNYFRISFSVKKIENEGNIQVHHGGSLFAYSKRFQSLGANSGIDFSFLGDKQGNNFQYVYVNELMHGDPSSFLQAFSDMLKGLGFLFLGEEVGNYKGADFLYIQDNIYPFSTVLQKIFENEDLIKVRVNISKNRKPIEEKVQLKNEKYIGEWYSDGFIKESQAIGQKAIYGVTYSIDLLKSAYNI